MPPQDDTSRSFDYVIVGAGSAGCVIANRLSEDPSVTVCLLEAGSTDRDFPVNVKSRIPAGGILFRHDRRYNWLYPSASTAGPDSRTILCPRGRLFGGTSSINGMIYMRGQPQDYDGWAALGQPRVGVRGCAAVFSQVGKFRGGRRATAWTGRRTERRRAAFAASVVASVRRGCTAMPVCVQCRLQRSHAERIWPLSRHPEKRRTLEHVAGISASRAVASESSCRSGCHRARRCVRRPSVERRTGAAWRCGLYGAGQARSHPQRRRDRFAATSHAVRHRPSRPSARTRHHGAARQPGRGIEPAGSLRCGDRCRRAVRHELCVVCPGTCPAVGSAPAISAQARSAFLDHGGGGWLRCVTARRRPARFALHLHADASRPGRISAARARLHRARQRAPAEKPRSHPTPLGQPCRCPVAAAGPAFT